MDEGIRQLLPPAVNQPFRADLVMDWDRGEPLWAV